VLSFSQVDDSHINQKILSRLLSAEGFSVAKANNGQVALDMVKKEPARFSVIFMVQLARPTHCVLSCCRAAAPLLLSRHRPLTLPSCSR
jgi:CheY-like chemotaxis protein